MKILCCHGYGNTKWWLRLRKQKMLFHEDSVLQLFYKIEFVFLVLLYLGTLSCWKTVVQCRIDYSTLFSKAFCWRFHSLLILGQIISTEIWDGYFQGTKINHQIILDFYNTVTWLRLGLGLFHCVWLERSRSWSISQLFTSCLYDGGF